MNINDIAKMAGVSRTTVSRVFHGGYVSEDAKNRIEQVIRETGYVPNVRAQALRMKRNLLLGVLVPGFDADHVRRVLLKILDDTEKKGYQTIVMRYKGSTDHLISQIRMLKSRGVDGMVLMLTTYNREIEQEIDRDYIPSVTIGPGLLKNVAGIMHDDAEGFALMTNFVLDKGYTKLGILFPPGQETMTVIRRNTVISILKEHGIEIPDKWNITSDKIGLEHSEYSEIFAKKILMLDELPDAFIAGSDRFAFRLIDALKSMGVRVPQDIAVTGFGNTEIGQYLRPALTTVDCNPDLLTEKALEFLFFQIDQHEKTTEHIKIAPFLVQRESI